jgi:hypothetical protein
MSENKMTPDEVKEYILEIPDDVMQDMVFSMPWQYKADGDGTYKDPDGFGTSGRKIGADNVTREILQQETWRKFHENPQINTTVRGQVGRTTGMGYEVVSAEPEIMDVIEEITYDKRNRLYNFTPAFVGRSIIEGELFLLLSCHPDGFIEVDFIDPSFITGKSSMNAGDDEGVFYHPSKSTMPLFYNVKRENGKGKPPGYMQIPSIYIAYYPSMIPVAHSMSGVDRKYQQESRSRKAKFKPFKGYSRFIVAWDKSFMTRRTVSHLRTILLWVNHYETLKKYEIDHKKSSGAYLWVIKVTEPRMFKLWLAMSDEDREKTGVMAKKTPGSTMVLPPGMEMQVINPNLPRISEQDTDVLDMVSSGLNEPEDIMMNRNKGSFATVKATRGPMSDRTSDELAYFQRFWLYDFWSSVFYLRSHLTDFPKQFKVKRAIGFDEKQEPIFKDTLKNPEFLTSIIFPTSESIDYEARAKGMLGTKHGPLSETLGVPMSTVSERMGFPAYGVQRLRKAEQDEKYPELIYTADAESIQEKAEGEPKQEKNKKQPKKKE